MRKVAINSIHDLAKRDPRVVFIGSDLGPGVLEAMRVEMPDRFSWKASRSSNHRHRRGTRDGRLHALHQHDRDVSDAPLFRAARVDVCMHHLPVRLIASGGGAVYAPLGPTHMAFDDFALLRTLPGMTVVAPCDAPEMGRVMDGSLDVDGPLYIRIAKGSDPVISRPNCRSRSAKRSCSKSPVKCCSSAPA